MGQYSQTVVQAALEVREQIPEASRITQVTIKTMQKAIDIMAGDPEKWKPETRETADHSMPYTTAVALTYGTVTQDHFDENYIKNPKLLELTGKVKVEASDEADRRAPEAMLCNLEVMTNDGETFSSEVPYHKGHYLNPMSDIEVENKFRSLAKNLLSPDQTDKLLHQLWHLEDVEDLKEIFKLTKI